MNYFIKAGKIINAWWRKRLLASFQKSKRLEQRIVGLEANIQKLLCRTYAEVSAPKTVREIFREHEFKACSQAGEDGLLLYIFSQIGATNRLFAEVAAGDGRVCNTANLSLHFGWQGVLVDGDKNNIEIAKKYYQERLGPACRRVKIINQFVTAENINQVLSTASMRGEIDLLSIDIDGNDYWLWRAITIVEPRVVAIEYNASFGRERSITIPYEPDFRRYKKHESGWYHGASLAALTKLGHRKGYVLVGCSSSGVNAFFIKKELAGGRLAALSAKEAYYPHGSRVRFAGSEEQFSRISHLPFTDV